MIPIPTTTISRIYQNEYKFSYRTDTVYNDTDNTDINDDDVDDSDTYNTDIDDKHTDKGTKIPIKTIPTMPIPTI